ncbi:T9SS type A sorting domain-containing protein, partial [bacterium]|nr:T9SS type A sorting domain-containing protein [bacterium]
NDIPEAGETVDLVVSVKNLLAPASNLNLELTVSTSALSIIDGTAQIPILGSGESVANIGDPLTIRISSQVGRGTRYRVTVLISTDDGQYQDRDYFDLVVAPTYLDHKVGNVTLTLTSQGNLGFNDFPANRDGRGFVFNRDGKNLLFEGAVLAGINPRQVSDVARRSPAGSKSTDFQTRPGSAIVFQRPGPEADEQSLATFSDRNRPFGTVGLDVTQEGLSFAAHPYDDFVLLKYIINNSSVVNLLDSLYFGLLLDWNIDQEHYKNNLAGFDAELQLGYMFSPDLPTYCGVRVLNSTGVASYRAINNATDLFNESFEFTEARKYEFLSGGLAKTTVTVPGDYSQLMSTGPFAIAPKDTVIAGFALIGGTDLDDLKRNAQVAQQKWDKIVGINLPGNLPVSFVLKQNYPNPFNPETTLEYELPKPAFLNITIYNILGQEITTLVNELFEAGRYVRTWDGLDRNGRAVGTGVYVARMITTDFSKSIKMLLIR